ncbi:MAG: hypothetical protein NTX88_06340 [Candidatus Atribacteria bacterium]|nr:hypothetical protein [Candidatus Atribacteria bacterium]
MDTIRVSCVQFQPKMGDVEWNLNTIAGYFEQGSITGSQVLVFPELIVQGYLPQIIESTAELVSGHACQLLTELSRK